MKLSRSGIIRVMLAFACLSLFHTLPVRAATCTATGGNVTLSALTITLQRDMPNGQTSYSSPIGTGGKYTCTGDVTTVTQHQFGINGNYADRNGSAFNGRTQYKLGDSGLGYTVQGISNSSSGCIASAYIGPGTTIAGLENTVRLCNSTGGLIPSPLVGGIQVDFFKIGPLTPGTIPSRLVGSFISQINNDAWTSPAVDIYSGVITLIEKACSVTTTAITVPMGDVPRDDFTGIGSTAAIHNFTILLDCDASTNINLQLDGAVVSGQPTVLTLNASTTPPAASGVGLQVLYAGNPVAMGAPILIATTSADGPYNIPLQARYYQTDSVVTGGLANSTATFTITYN